MAEKNEKEYTPLLPFNPSVAEHFEMYDTFPYNNERDMTHPLINTMETGNLLKFYRINTEDEPKKITE